MRRFLPALLLVAFISTSCESGVQKAETKKETVCTEDTLLASGKGIRITLGDYRYVEELLKPKAKDYFSKHPEDLLNRMINRRLVIKYVEDSGLAKKYGLDREIERFKKEYLSRYYVSLQAQEVAEKVTDEEIVKRFKELFPDKDPSKMTEGDRKFIRNELKVKKYDEAVRDIYASVEKKIAFTQKDGRVVASCCGIEVAAEGKDTSKLKEKLKKELLTEYFYRKAVEKGYDKNPEFQRMLTEYYAGKAIEVFRKELRKKITVTEEEIKRFYEQNREKFKMPERAKAVVFYFRSKERAEKAKEELEKGKDWKQVARAFAQFTAKEKSYYNDPKDPVGTLIFMGGDKKAGKVLIADLGSNRYIVVKVLKFIPPKEITLTEARNYITLRLEGEKLREKEKELLKSLREKYGVKLFRENFECLKG
ncbi:peptidyl-prolyl cis-trans isomerase [Phorcysia thermohydrogeniphila]|uniref:Parvulin-like peptidyl-prolyl cis-trans isomerase protein n=1 Tax=Phorcysia thermohydrogeniphila TaxID=936138 RepID=A0A4R1GK27_9BACT|nr:peptidylprolyl isomerase [Phorcysia thermohydrogeniphila]TCK04632.1 parvulin-like peptidyl-prolyl cis-trans isomerase protein [Phorcysia thermohydrogeniphila]